MAEITRKRSGELIRGVFKILLAHPEDMSSKEVLGKLATIVPPTPFENSSYASSPDDRRYEYIVRFSTIAFVKAGWISKNKGFWSLTDDGRKAYQEFTDPERFRLEAQALYRKWAKSQPKEDEEEEDEEEITTAATIEESEERAWKEISEHLAAMNPYDFQELVAGLLRGMGYHVAWISPPGADRGTDIIAHSDPLGVTGPRIKVQVKRRPNDRTGVDGIRSFMATLADGDIGLFVSSGGFSKDAEDEARRQEKRRLMLVDLTRLFDLWVEHYAKIPEPQRRLLPLRPIYFLAEDE